jgi:hypothetical protein
MKNFSMTKKVVVAAGMLALCSGQFTAFGSGITNDELDGKSSKQLVSANTNSSDSAPIIPVDVMKLIFSEVCKSTDPLCLEFVCKHWQNIMNYPAFKEDIMIINKPFQLKKQFYNGVLRWTSPDDGTVVTKKFSDYKNGGMVDIADCGNMGNCWAIYIGLAGMDSAFEVGGKNDRKLVLLIILPQEAKKGVKPGHPLASLVAQFNAENPIMLWRDGNDPITSFDHLITADMKIISDRNLFENWRNAIEHRAGWLREGGDAWLMWDVSCSFFEPK